MQLSLCTFNLKDFFAPSEKVQKEFFEERVQLLGAQIAALDCNAIALQEVGSLEAVQRLFQAAGNSWAKPHIRVAPPDHRGICNAFVSQLPIEASEVITSPDVGFPIFQQGDPAPFPGRIPVRRGILSVRLKGLEIQFFVCHLKSKLPAGLKDAGGKSILPQNYTESGEAHLRSWVLRAGEAVHLRRKIDEKLQENPGLEVIVLGDFNDTLSSLPVQIILGISPVAFAGKLYSCHNHLNSEQQFSTLHFQQKNQIDHILVTEKLRNCLQSAEIRNESLRDHGPFIEGTPLSIDSDHAPVIARFEI